MLLPALGKAREKARQISCVSNLKQVGIVITLYADDNNDMCPSFYAANGSAGGNIFYPYLLYPYLNNGKTWKCPSCTNFYYNSLCPDVDASSFNGANWKISYLQNRTCTSTASNSERYDKGMTRGRLTNPSDTINYGCATLAADGPQQSLGLYKGSEKIGTNDIVSCGYFNDSGNGTLTTGFGPEGQAPHGGNQADVVWCDGHAGGVGEKNTTATMWIYLK